VSKKSQRNRRKLDPKMWGGSDALFDDDLEFDDDSTDWMDDDGEAWWAEEADESRVSVRRKIERRREKQQLYSELNDWEQFGRHQ
jgi:hypothetical protein